MWIKTLAVAGALAGGLSACGDTTGEQLLYGAGAGAAGAVLIDGDVATGAVLGAGGNYLYCQENPSKC